MSNDQQTYAAAQLTSALHCEQQLQHVNADTYESAAAEAVD